MWEQTTDERTRLLIRQACRVLVSQGLVAGFGHVSARLPGGEQPAFLITPREPLAVVEEETLALVEAGRPTGSNRPPLEWPMHAAIYERRADVKAICRTHSKMVSALGVAGRQVQAVHGFGCWLGPVVPLFESPLLGSSAEQAAAIAEALGDGSAVVLRGNGSITTGSSVEEAAVRAVFLEESAELQLLASLAGGARALDEATVRERHAMDAADEVRRAWQHCLALLGGG